MKIVAKWLNQRQTRTLAARYLDVILGDRLFCAMLLGEALFIAALFSVVWQGKSSDPKLYFFLSVVCAWFGCFGACRELVKEKAIFLRERMVNLGLIPYVRSKLRVLSIVALVQTFILVLVLKYYIDIQVNTVCFFILLFLTQVAGTALGLFLSSVPSSQNTAVVLAVMAMIPQVLFSKFFLGQLLTGVSEKIEQYMITKWTFHCLEELAKGEIDKSAVAQDAGVLLLFTVGFLLLTVLVLKGKEY